MKLGHYYKMVSASRRRETIKIIQQNGEMDLTDLAERIGAGEENGTIGDLPTKQQKRVYVSIYQTHVPRLEDQDIVSFDKDKDQVKPDQNLEEAALFLRIFNKRFAQSSDLITKEETPNSTSDESASVEPAVTKDIVAEILKNSRRRSVLELVENGYDQLWPVAEKITAQENDIDVKKISANQQKKVFVGLHQCHLPKMDSAGIIEFDEDRGSITAGEYFDFYFDVHQKLKANFASHSLTYFWNRITLRLPL